MTIIHIITGLNDGGAEGVLYRLCTHDERNKHIVISMMDEGKYGPPLQSTGVAVYCLNMPRGKVTARGLINLYRLLRKFHPDVVQTWMYHADLIGGVVARLAGVKAVCWGIRHSNLDPGKSARSTIIIARLCAKLSRWVPRVIVSCSAQAAAVHQRLGYAKNKFTIISNGYNLNEFSPWPEKGKKLRAEWDIADQTPLLGMVARYDPQKDHHNLLNALTLLKKTGPDFCCVLIGTDVDDNNQSLRKVVEESGLQNNVKLLGRRTDIPAVMSALDVHVLSSLGEAFPNVVAEAMACGTPCIATDVGESGLIVGDCGWIIPASNSKVLFEAISLAISEMEDHDQWRACKAACREHVVSHFSIEKMVEAFHAAWQRAQ